MHLVVVFRDAVEKDEDLVALDEPLEQRMSWLAYKQSAPTNSLIIEVPPKRAGDHIPLILVCLARCL
jgi:hypothetical protein